MGFKLSLLQAASLIGVSTLFSSQVAAAPFEDVVSQPFFSRDDSNTNYTHTLATGGTWTSGFAKAQALVDQMTIEEKVNVTTGYTGKCVGFSGEVSETRGLIQIPIFFLPFLPTRLFFTFSLGPKTRSQRPLSSRWTSRCTSSPSRFSISGGSDRCCLL